MIYYDYLLKSRSVIAMALLVSLLAPEFAAKAQSTTTSSPLVAQSINAVNLRTAGGFAILSKSGITDVPTSSVSGGNVGSSPISGSGILLTCPEVSGIIYETDAGGPGCFVTDPTLLTAAVSDMQAAYVDAAGRTDPDTTELGAGEIGGLTILPGLHKWSSDVTISTDVTLYGSPTDVWIFQIAGMLNLANGQGVILTGGALAKNIFWQIAGSGVTVGTTAVMEGTILSAKLIALNTGAVLNGQALAQTAVNLETSTITSTQLMPNTTTSVLGTTTSVQSTTTNVLGTTTSVPSTTTNVLGTTKAIVNGAFSNLTASASDISKGVLMILGSAIALFL